MANITLTEDQIEITVIALQVLSRDAMLLVNAITSQARAQQKVDAAAAPLDVTQ